ncbi:MAG: PIN domain-containing protein [Firmicutes bacterium]|nr:PIN domain-containing protein [Bacillota bacterium]
MPRRILIDAGPLIALFDRDDADHEWTREFLAGYRGRLVTSWAVVTEALYMLDFNLQAQLDFLEWLRREALVIPPFTKAHLTRVIELMRKYADVPMDFADATLMVLAESEEVMEILTLDSDFDIYRTQKGEALKKVW